MRALIRATAASFIALVGILSASIPAVAVPMQQQQQEAEPAQSSGIVTPNVATGFIKVDDWRHFPDGSLAIGWCAKTSWTGSCADQRWLSPVDAVKKLRGEKTIYAGFVLFVLKDSTRLYLFTK